MKQDVDTPKEQASALRLVLGRPPIHLIAGAAFALLFTWPILAFENPLSTWAFMYFTWVAATAVLFVLSRGEEVDDSEQGFDDTGDKVASIPAPKGASVRPEALEG